MSGLLQTTANNDCYAQLVSKDGDPQRGGFTLTRDWEKLHAREIDTLTYGRDKIILITDPTAQPNQYAGTFLQS